MSGSHVALCLRVPTKSSLPRIIERNDIAIFEVCKNVDVDIID